MKCEETGINNRCTYKSLLIELLLKKAWKNNILFLQPLGWSDPVCVFKL